MMKVLYTYGCTAYPGNNGHPVKPKSLLGKGEQFSFDIPVSKDGFTEYNTISVTVPSALPFELKGYWKLIFYTNSTRTIPVQAGLIDFQDGAKDLGLSVSYTMYPDGKTDSYGRGNMATWNQSFDPTTLILSLTNNYWKNILYEFIYNPHNPNELIGQSIGLSNNGFNLKLIKQ